MCATSDYLKMKCNISQSASLKLLFGPPYNESIMSLFIYQYMHSGHLI